MFGLNYIRNVATLRLDRERCTGCGACAEVCPHAVLSLSDGKAAIADLDSCMECGACAINCPVEAITVRAGVGCAAAIIAGAIKGTDSSCGCGGDSCCG